MIGNKRRAKLGKTSPPPTKPSSMKRILVRSPRRGVLKAKQVGLQYSLGDLVDPLLEQVNGRQLRWRAERILGQGSEGQVLKVFDITTGDSFAVKRLFLKESEAKRSIIQEVEILKSIGHTNIVKYLGSETVLDNACIYLEYMPRGSIKSLISRKGAIHEQQAVLYTKQILEGVKYLHNHGIVHRDIKGANILLDRNGNVKISDFGCSRKFDPTIESGLLSTISGSLSWTAPEVLKQSGYGRKADVWSVGCTLLEMLTGNTPWAEVGHHFNVIMKIVNSEDTPFIPLFLSSHARDFLEKCLQRDPELRPTVSQLKRHPLLINCN